MSASLRQRASGFHIAIKKYNPTRHRNCIIRMSSLPAKGLQMLVLTRKVSEKIRIGDAVTVVVTAINGHTVRLGIEAPQSTRIVRAELLNKQLGQAR